MDKSNGYESIASTFIKWRGQNAIGIGAATVRTWCKSLPKGAAVLDLGCGTGIPITKVLFDEGMMVYGIDASASMVSAFQQHFPNTPVACEAVEDSAFFNRQFDAIIAWGLIFLLPQDTQETVIQKVADALQPGGKFLFTAPAQKTTWEDVMTGHQSLSLGADRYIELLSITGLSLIEELEDEGGNHYFHAGKLISS
jgi:2-polyprenyl-3-methyl-5-hydroxy-6-metoxy-1,4-benzoquinol methylase